MKNKKLKLSILLSLIFMFVSLCFSNTVKAVGANEELYLGIQEYRQTSDPENMGYAIKNPDDNGTSEETMVGANYGKSYNTIVVVNKIMCIIQIQLFIVLKQE